MLMEDPRLFPGLLMVNSVGVATDELGEARSRRDRDTAVDMRRKVAISDATIRYM